MKKFLSIIMMCLFMINGTFISGCKNDKNEMTTEDGDKTGDDDKTKDEEESSTGIIVNGVEYNLIDANSERDSQDSQRHIIKITVKLTNHNAYVHESFISSTFVIKADTTDLVVYAQTGPDKYSITAKGSIIIKLKSTYYSNSSPQEVNLYADNKLVLNNVLNWMSDNEVVKK